MTQLACFAQLSKFGGLHPRTDFALQGHPSRRGIHAPGNLDVLNFLAHARKNQGKGIHYKPGIDTRAQDRSPVFSGHEVQPRDRKSTRLNSSHVKISYAVFCLKKKKK